MTPDFSTPDGCGAAILAIVERDRRIPLEVRSEVAQRTYLRIRSGQANGLSVNYVRKVALNIFIDLLRDEKRRTAAEREAEKRPASRREADSDAQCIDQPFLTTRIMDEVAALPEYLRVVMERTIDGDMPAEIAAILRIPSGTVRWRLRQARLRIPRGLGMTYAQAGTQSHTYNVSKSGQSAICDGTFEN